MTNLNPKEAEVLISKGEVVVIDARTPEECHAARIKGSVNIDFLDKSFPPKIEELDKNAKYLVYCQSGGRSVSACALMEQKGFKNIFNLEGGLTAWIGEDLPLGK